MMRPVPDRDLQHAYEVMRGIAAKIELKGTLAAIGMRITVTIPPSFRSVWVAVKMRPPNVLAPGPIDVVLSRQYRPDEILRMEDPRIFFEYQIRDAIIHEFEEGFFYDGKQVLDPHPEAT